MDIRYQKIYPDCGNYFFLAALLLLLSVLVSVVNATTDSGDASGWRQLINNNIRSAFDLSTRRYDDLKSNHWQSQHVLGFDLHKVFSGEHGDIGTLVFQPYLVRLNHFQSPPFFFDDGDDWELTWRIANFNFTGLANNGFNIRFGHFEVPFGLEQNIDTNGTLRQYTFSNRGIKVDWGASINGVLPAMDYEFAISRGSGNDYTDRDDPYLLSGRVGSPSHRNLVFGFSYMYGDVLAKDGTLHRKRLGLDVARYVNNYELLFEVSGGEDEDAEVFNALAEISWRNPAEIIHLYSQIVADGKKEESAWEDRFTSRIGVNWAFYPQCNLSASWHKTIDVFNEEQKSSELIMQLRVRL